MAFEIEAIMHVMIRICQRDLRASQFVDVRYTNVQRIAKHHVPLLPSL